MTDTNIKSNTNQKIAELLAKKQAINNLNQSKPGNFRVAMPIMKFRTQNRGGK